MSAPRPTREELEEMAMAHLLGALDGPDAKRFEELRAAADPELLGMIEEHRATAEALLHSGPSVAPPPDLRRRILGAARERTASAAERPTTPGGARAAGTVVALPSPRNAPLRAGLALAAAAALAVGVWQTVALRERLSRAERAATEARLRAERMAGEVEALRTTSERQAELLRLLEDPESGLITLAALKPAPGASAKVLWDAKARRGYLWVRNLPVDGPERDYQLWALEGSRPVSAGVFSVSADGTALVPLDTLGLTAPVGAFAITLEPAGGLPAPSGEILLLGSVGG